MTRAFLNSSEEREMTSGPVIEYCASRALFFQSPPLKRHFPSKMFHSPPVLLSPVIKIPISAMNIFEPRGRGVSGTNDWKVIAHASCALTPTEQRYAQPEREAVVIVYSVKHFHLYLYGAPDFELETENKPFELIYRQDHVCQLELKDGCFDSQTTASLSSIYQAKKPQ